MILAVNAGSSSVRLALYAISEEPPVVRAAARYERDPITRPEDLLDRFWHEEASPDTSLSGVVHRVVHGGATLTTPCLITPEVEAEIERLCDVAPLHNPPALEWIRLIRARHADAPQVAAFDTAFFAHLPQVAATYALPRELCERHALRRYGFHGLAHEALWRRYCALQPALPDGGRVITLQLGAGCSATAIDRGRAVDTSMGFSPLEGLVMATRSGDVDPGLLTYLQRAEGLSADALDALLNERSGLLGLSGISGDMRDLAESASPHAMLARAVFAYRVRKYVGAYLAVLGGADALVFGGGIGEYAADIRAEILADMAWCGITLNLEANAAARGIEARIDATETDGASVWVIPVDEARLMVEHAAHVLRNAR